MKHFVKGALLGGIVGGIYALYQAPQSGKETRQQLKEIYQPLVNDTVKISKDAQRIQKSLNILTEQALPLFKKTTQSTQQTLREFEESTRPRVRRLQEKLNTLNEHIKNLD